MNEKDGTYEYLSKLLETVIPDEHKHAGWELLEETTNSGKSLFKCKTCGRVSPTPDKYCYSIKDALDAIDFMDVRV